MVVERLAERWSAPAFREKFKAETTKGMFQQRDVVLLKPQTFMNLSGESVQPAMAFYKVELPQVVCVHDELDLEFGVVRVKVGGGTAGHNGLKSMVQRCGGNGFLRVRVGIGRPPVRTESHVLSDFDSSERAELGDVVDRACDMVEATIVDGATAAMNRYHGA
jgi:PTH1 family peptidyl-tRNA hydrolase